MESQSSLKKSINEGGLCVGPVKHLLVGDMFRDENFQRIREMSRILSRQDRSCESSRSVEIFF